MTRAAYVPPEITIRREPFGAMHWRLMATSHGRTEIVGPRILRGNGVLSIDVRHATKEAAEDAATKLRAYLAALGKEKAAKDQDPERVEGRPVGHWEL